MEILIGSFTVWSTVNRRTGPHSFPTTNVSIIRETEERRLPRCDARTHYGTLLKEAVRSVRNGSRFSASSANRWGTVYITVRSDEHIFLTHLIDSGFVYTIAIVIELKFHYLSCGQVDSSRVCSVSGRSFLSYLSSCRARELLPFKSIIRPKVSSPSDYWCPWNGRGDDRIGSFRTPLLCFLLKIVVWWYFLWGLDGECLYINIYCDVLCRFYFILIVYPCDDFN